MLNLIHQTQSIIKSLILSISQELESHLSGFEKIFDKFLSERRTGNSIVWDKIQPLLEDSVIPYAALKEAPEVKARSMLDKLVVLKLNGGLGTSMGCVGPKSLISVRSDRTFLDLTVEQIEVSAGVGAMPLYSVPEQHVFECWLEIHALLLHWSDGRDKP